MGRSRRSSGLTRQEKRRSFLWALGIVAALLAVIAGIVLIPRALRERAALSPVSEAVSRAAEGLDDITVEMNFDPDASSASLTETLVLCNRTGQDQPAVVLRSETGAFEDPDTSPAGTEELYDSCYYNDFIAGGLTVSRALVNGQETDRNWQDDAMTVLSLAVPGGWKAGETVTVTLTCFVYIPDCAARFGKCDGIYALGNLFPLPAVWEDGAWRTDAYSSVGDPFYSECSNWHVTLTCPSDCTVAASAWAEPDVTDGTARYVYEAPAMRDFALVVSRSFVSRSAMEGDVLVTACAKDDSTASAMLKAARQALRCYGALWGADVYQSLTLVQTCLQDSGMSYPGLTMLGEAVCAAGGQTLELAAARETAHQWWGALVGSDPVNQAWQDESLCEYAMIDYIGDYYGSGSREDAVFSEIESALRITVPKGVVPGSPITYFSDGSEYRQVVRQRGAALWMALETYLGRETLDGFLKQYAGTFAFSIAGREDLTALLNEYTGQDLTDLMTDYLDTEMS